MARIHELLEEVKDPSLRRRLSEEVANLTRNKKFGLVFEDHEVERTLLYGVNIRAGMPAVKKAGKINEVWDVLKVEDGQAMCRRSTTGEIATIASDELVAVAQFGDPIFPTLQPMDHIENAPDSSLWHTLIEADNYHALQLLEYLYAGKVDCIYIDPPYNTGARDWKYNNDYIDGSDAYRHSKWLSMMEKRLRIAKRLLNPVDSVMIITIDEKEYLHLGCLLEEVFPEARIQMVSSVINSAGVSRGDEFSRSNEFIFFVKFGLSSPCSLPLSDEWRGNMKSKKKNKLVWNQLMRAGTNARRIDRPNLFYPLFISDDGLRIVEIGDPIDILSQRETVKPLPGTKVVWPIRSNGEEGNWQIEPSRLRNIYSKGYVRLGSFTSKGMAITYLKSGEQKKVENGVFSIIGHREDGSIIEGEMEEARTFIPGTQWDIPSHNATYFGSQLLNKILGEKRFDYPKSLYAVQDALRFFVKNKPSALIVDFFAGSGTTMHAVNLLNADDDGQRRCIMVTNNEVSAEEARRLGGAGYHPGDAEWEKYGIARYVTWPRTCCSILGQNVKQEPLSGEYVGTDISMANGFQANVEYFKLSFLDRNMVSLGIQFREILPLLWLKSGAVGKRPELPSDEELPEMMVLPKNGFAILLEEECFADFARCLAETSGIHIVYFVTDSEDAFREMSANVPAKQTFQLYRDYIDNFVIGRRRTTR